jgi:hypothetical protein
MYLYRMKRSRELKKSAIRTTSSRKPNEKWRDYLSVMNLRIGD